MLKIKISYFDSPFFYFIKNKSKYTNSILYYSGQVLFTWKLESYTRRTTLKWFERKRKRRERRVVNTDLKYIKRTGEGENRKKFDKKVI